MTEKELDILADKVREKLSRGPLKKDRYKETEAMLRSYTNYMNVIRMNNDRIEDIIRNGLGEIRKSRIEENVQGGMKKFEGLPEKELEKIEHIKSENLKMEKRIIRVENAMENIRNDRYSEIIELRYFKNWTIEEIAEKLNVDRRTVGRNRTRLVKSMQYDLFPEVFLD